MLVKEQPTETVLPKMEAGKDNPNEAPKRNPRSGSILTDSAAALVSSTFFATSFYPLHRIKILLQTQDSNPLVVNGQVKRYTMMDAVPRLAREGGLRELWRGNGAYMLRHVPSTTLSFALKDAALRVLPHFGAADQLGRATAVNLAAGFFGGAAALLLVYPLDFATIRMAAELRQHKKSQGIFETLDSTKRNGGLAALYRGYGVSAVAIGAYKALYFGLYDTACAILEQRSRASTPSAASPSATSALSPSFLTPAADPGPNPNPTPNPSSTSPPPPLSPTSSSSSTLSISPPSHAPPSSSSPASHPGPGPGLLSRWAVANVVVIAASSLTYPLDVVRKRLVADTALGPARQQYAGLADCVAQMARKEGVRGFYRFYGYDMLLRLGGGVLLVLYDELKAHGPAALASQLMGGQLQW